MKPFEEQVITAYQDNQDPAELRQLAADSASAELALISADLNQD